MSAMCRVVSFLGVAAMCGVACTSNVGSAGGSPPDASSEAGNASALGDSGTSEHSRSDASANKNTDSGGVAPCAEEWRDPESQYVWQVTPVGDASGWQSAIDRCEALSLCGHDDWHLPTISELRSLIRTCPFTELGGACGVTDDCLTDSCHDGDKCKVCGETPSGTCRWPDEMKGECDHYWSSSANTAVYAWWVTFTDAWVSASPKGGGAGYARCVRSTE